MRAAAILGLGCSGKDLSLFQTDSRIDWRIGMPAPGDDLDIILLFGGDGTIHRHLGSLVNLGLPVLVVPAGSGNDFACSLALRRMRDSLAAWEEFRRGAANVRTIDLGLITPIGRANEALSSGTYFCCVAGVGLDGEVARRANQLPRWLRGHGGYALSMLPTIFSFAPFLLKISVTAGEHSEWTLRSHQPTMVAAFANSPLYGGGMKIAPRATMDDGLLDLCIVAAVSPLRLLRLFPSVYAGQHLGIREVEYFQAERARVESEESQDVYADGEFVCRTPVEVSIERAALNVVTLA
jgi:diacylglycerol kinase (ATP)